jgi:hypothetical protein
VRLVHLRDVTPYQEGLRRLEADVRYPIEGDHFRIDHGPRYATFFERMGDAHFLLALDGDEVVGTFAGIGKWAQSGERRVPAVYGADWKIAPAWRGGRLAPKFLTTGIRMAFERDVPRWRLTYVAAMRGNRGDVMRAAPRWSPMRLGRPVARLAIYFTPRASLLMMDPAGCPAVPAGGLDLSPDVFGHVISNAGCKDLILESTGQPWPLWHLPRGPRAWVPSFAAYARRAAEQLPEKATACFGVDERLELVKWLASREVKPGGTCTIYMFRLPFTPRPEPWVHLATSEI